MRANRIDMCVGCLLLLGVWACGGGGSDSAPANGGNAGEAGQGGETAGTTGTAGNAADASVPPDSGTGGKDSEAGTGCAKDSDCSPIATAPPNCAQAKCESGVCVYYAKDADGDGHATNKCQSSDAGVDIQGVGDDCDDSDASVNPKGWDGPAGNGKPSGCGDGLDNDCNGMKDDGTLPVSGGTATCICSPGQTQPCSQDENGQAIDYPELDPQGKPLGACKLGTQTCSSGGKWSECDGAKGPSQEVCSGDDNDCDGVPSTEDPDTVDRPIWSYDEDADGYRSAKYATVTQCLAPTTAPADCVGACPADKWSSDKVAKPAGDCDDTNFAVNPGATDISPDSCDGIDNNCDGNKDPGCGCVDKNTRHCGPLTDEGECVFGLQTCNQGNWTSCVGAVEPATEVCDDLDNDCDGLVDEGCDDDKDGFCDKAMSVVGQPAVCPGGGGDCSDAAGGETVNPGQNEKCDNVDNNCDSIIDEACDADGDDFCDSNMEIVGTPNVCLNGGNDCDDTNKQVNPAATEKCDGIADDNCNGTKDEGCACVTGTTQNCGVNNVGLCKLGVQTCNQAGQWSSCAGAVLPAPSDPCDTYDNDCDGTVDEGCNCVNGATRNCGDTEVGECKYGLQTCDSGQWSPCAGYVGPATEVCDNLDNDCDGQTDEGCDDDGDDYCDKNMILNGSSAACPKGGGDCDDAPGKAAINPGAAEICDNVDNNCAGSPAIDEGCDDDNDNYCDKNMTVVGTPTTCTGAGKDCNDTNFAVNPSATELCDDIDNDCDGYMDEVCDKDGDGYCDAMIGHPYACPGDGIDCNDSDPYRFPGAPESCDGIDQSCDGAVDEATFNGTVTPFAACYVAVELPMHFPEGTYVYLDSDQSGVGTDFMGKGPIMYTRWDFKVQNNNLHSTVQVLGRQTGSPYVTLYGNFSTAMDTNWNGKIVAIVGTEQVGGAFRSNTNPVCGGLDNPASGFSSFKKLYEDTTTTVDSGSVSFVDCGFSVNYTCQGNVVGVDLNKSYCTFSYASTDPKKYIWVRHLP